MNQKMRKKKTNRAISTMTVAVFFVLLCFFCFVYVFLFLFFFVLFCFWFVLFCFCGVTKNFGIGTLTVNDSCALMYYKFHWK